MIFMKCDVNLFKNDDICLLYTSVYKLGGFKDSLVKTTNISDSDEATKFIKSINENKDKKEDLNKLYALSKYRKFTICAPDDDSLNNIIEELTKRGFVYNE